MKNPEEAGEEGKRRRNRLRGLRGRICIDESPPSGEPGPSSLRHDQIIAGSEAEKEAVWSVVVSPCDDHQSHSRRPGYGRNRGSPGLNFTDSAAEPGGKELKQFIIGLP